MLPKFGGILGLYTYWRRLNEGVCTRCCSPELATKTLCEPCRQRQKAIMYPRTKRLRMWWRSQGLCIYCGKIRAPGLKSCDYCADRGKT
jgi:hypothetical protein